MSVDTIHILVAAVFVGIWTSILLLFRLFHLHEMRNTLQDPDEFH